MYTSMHLYKDITRKSESIEKMSFQSTLKPATESASFKRSSHKSFPNAAETYEKDRAPYPLVLNFGTTSMYLSLDPNYLIIIILQKYALRILSYFK